MVSEQPARKIVKAFKSAGWRWVRTVISPGLVRKLDTALAECGRLSG